MTPGHIAGGLISCWWSSGHIYLIIYCPVKRTQTVLQGNVELNSSVTLGGLGYWPPPLQKLPVSWSCGHIEGARIYQKLATYIDRGMGKSLPAYLNYISSKLFTFAILRILTFLGIDLCKLCKPDVITYSNTYFTKCCKERYKLWLQIWGEQNYIKVT